MSGRWGGRFAPNAEGELRRTLKEPVSVWRKEWRAVAPNSANRILKWVKTKEVVDFTEDDLDGDVYGNDAGDQEMDEQAQLEAENEDVTDLSRPKADFEGVGGTTTKDVSPIHGDLAHPSDDVGAKSTPDAIARPQVSASLDPAGVEIEASAPGTEVPAAQQVSKGDDGLGDLESEAEAVQDERALIPPVETILPPAGGTVSESIG